MPTPTGDLREIALLLLRPGTLAFAGPAAHIAMIEGEVGQVSARLAEQEEGPATTAEGRGTRDEGRHDSTTQETPT
jgi:hypothetical protein